MADLTLKIGDTLLADCIYTDANDAPVDLVQSGIHIDSVVRSPDGLATFALTVTIRDQATHPGGYRIVGASDAWTAGPCLWDVRYTQDGYSSSTRTMTIDVQRRVS